MKIINNYLECVAIIFNNVQLLTSRRSNSPSSDYPTLRVPRSGCCDDTMSK
jgi:hypothetical protein